MKSRNPCRRIHKGPFVRTAPNVLHCRGCGDSWQQYLGEPLPNEPKPLTMRQAMARSFWRTILGGLILWGVLALFALAAKY